MSVKGDGPACLGRRQGCIRPFGWEPGLDFPSFPGMTPEDRDEVGSEGSGLGHLTKLAWQLTRVSGWGVARRAGWVGRKDPSSWF